MSAGHRERREVSNELLHVLAQEFPVELGVSEGRMFNGQGLKADGRFFAFISRAGRLVVKLSEADVHGLTGAGEAEPVTMGTRTMREWVSLPPPPDGDLAGWRAMLERARVFTMQTPPT